MDCCRLRENEPQKKKALSSALAGIGSGGGLDCIGGMCVAGSGDDRCDAAAIRAAV